ncbi:ArdC family protein [Leucobacter sp. wl10]|uniref:ArdC family protein n=1 Tax=Leucobacter sp. wl10 TaxID=2304677 RepID=UPI001F08A4CB|nr:ArdC family protein [Leucobacter sp. wl10]
MTKIKTRKSPAERRAELEQLHAMIAEQVDALTDSETWANVLRMATLFRRYSLNNLLLIRAQCPHATRVAGYRTWQKLGRQVRAGEKHIKIIGRQVKTIEHAEDSGEDKVQVYWPQRRVFDISQTDPIPGADQIPDPAPRLRGGDNAGIYEAAYAWLTEDGWTVERSPLSGEDGHTDPRSRIMRIEESLEPAHASLTILHEAAHGLLPVEMNEYHQHQGLYEAEAESIAYVVAGTLGQDTSANSIGYIATWTRGDRDVLRASGVRVIDTAHRILAAITEVTDPDTDAD